MKISSKNIENIRLYKEVKQLCNELPITKVLEKMLELMNGMPDSMEKRVKMLHYELTKMKIKLDYNNKKLEEGLEL